MSAFLSVTKDNTIQERNTLAIWITLWILIISGVLLFFGGFIFKIFGITLDAFRIGTGALLFLTAVSLVRGDSLRVPSGDSVQSLAVVPMAIPITLGPASIGVLMVYGGEIKTGLGFSWHIFPSVRPSSVSGRSCWFPTIFRKPSERTD